MSSVVLEKVSKRFGETPVVHGIDLTIAPKEFVVLVGPSGCGKSTTLRMIAGLEDISEGTISISNRIVNRVAPKERDVAMVFQNYALYPHLSVAENIAFGLRLRKVKKPEVERAVNEAATMLSLTELLERKPAELSGGQRQRVAMGRALVRHPKVFLFDEPLSNLDAKLRTQMRAEIKRLHLRIGVTSIYVTHDQVEAMTLADRIVIMNSGRIEQIGTPMELFLNPANTFVAGFLGSPPMNLINGTISIKNGKVGAQLEDNVWIQVPHSEQLAKDQGRSVVLGIRPEDVSVREGLRKNQFPVPCVVDLVEPLGSEALLHCNIGHANVVVKTETRSDVNRLNGLSQLFVDLDCVHLFDRESGAALIKHKVS